jgi:hypothetical protein
MIIPLTIWLISIPVSVLLGWLTFHQYIMIKLMNDDPRLLKLILKIRNSHSLKEELLG